MKQSTYFTLTAFIFLVLAVMHVLRIVNDWHAQIGDVVVVQWISWLAAFVGAYLAYWGFKFGR